VAYGYETPLSGSLPARASRGERARQPARRSSKSQAALSRSSFVKAPALPGIAPATNIYSNDWGQAAVEVEANSATFLRDGPPVGSYVGCLMTFPGERVGVSVASSVGTADTLVAALQWVGTTSEIRFGLQLAASGNNGLALVPELLVPQKLWSFPSEGTCGLAWEALTNQRRA
jgi:hypothetical protein